MQGMKESIRNLGFHHMTLLFEYFIFRERTFLLISCSQSQKETPNIHLSSVFKCTRSVHARITPFMSMYLLDFVDNSSKRIEGCIDLDVFDGEEGEHIYDLIKPLGKHYSTDCELEIDMLHSESARAYEIRSAGDLLKTLRFPTIITTTVQCA